MLPVLILQHYRENLKKCSLTPVRSVEEIEFRKIYPHDVGDSLTVEGGVVLAMHSPPLSSDDAAFLKDIPGGQLILIDGNWAKIPFLLNNLKLRPPECSNSHPEAQSASIADRLIFRSLPDSILTAYPRRSKLRDDPEGGLASIEALVAALHILGDDALGLLEGYHWREEFIDLNRDFLSSSSFPKAS